jgi:GT2 family glycosyltransferase
VATVLPVAWKPRIVKIDGATHVSHRPCASVDCRVHDEDSAVSELAELTVVVLNWNLARSTIRCVESLIGDGVPPSRIVVVDNGSTDDSAARFSNELPDCRLVRLPENTGFARGVNAGAGVLPGTHYLLVNNDAFARSGAVGKMLDALTRDDVGIVVPRLRNPDMSLQPSVSPLMTPGTAFIRASGLSRLIPDRWQPNWSTHWSHSHSRVIETAIGAVVLVRGETWHGLGGLDESTFMYGEDHDLCWRARESGWNVWFCAEAEFIHVGGSSAGARWGDPQRAERVAQAERQLVLRRLPGPRASAALFFSRVGLLGRMFVFRLRGRHPEAAACAGWLRGYGRSDSSAHSRTRS